MTKEYPSDRKFIVIGGGPAGLTTAYELTKFNYRPIVFEKNDKVGGIARTENYKGFYFDLGGHRFFTKHREVDKLWHEMIGKNFLRRPRLSRIFYGEQFYHYPLKPFNVLGNLGLWESFRVGLSYLKWQVKPYPREDNFEEWVTNRFGRRLFLKFFKTYTEKVWGISCTELKAEWAAQRIKDLSFKTVLMSMLVKPKNTITTLIEEFDYPCRGPGMMWAAFSDEIEQRNGTVRLNTDVVRILRTGSHIDAVVISQNGQEEVVGGTDFISTMPIRELIEKLDPPAPENVLKCARSLVHRDFLTLCLVINQPQLFPDNWIYIHEASVKVGRIQNFKNWSPDMVPDPDKTSLGLEYFCNAGDELWNTSDDELIELGKRELEKIGLALPEDIEDGCVVRVSHTYPVYDSGYEDHLLIVREFVSTLDNLQTIGRNGLHRYNNQDHSMLTGMLAVRNMVLGEENDLWSVNAEQEYHEEVREDADIEHIGEVVHEAAATVFRRIDRTAFGVSLGMATSIALFLATVWLVFKGGEVVGPNMQLLGQYFPGYSVSPSGSALALGYGFVVGFVCGWGFALLRNVSTFLTIALFQRRAERKLLRKLWDYI